jgi:hypothetical protein
VPLLLANLYLLSFILLLRPPPPIPHLSSSLVHQISQPITTHNSSILRLLTQEWFGVATGEMLFNFSRGVDHTQLECLPERKSIGVEVNWGIRFTDRAKAARFFTFVCVELATRIYQVLIWAGAELILHNIVLRFCYYPSKLLFHLVFPAFTFPFICSFSYCLFLPLTAVLF